MIKIKPLSNRVVVKRSSAKVSKGGILLPDSAQEKPKEGQVVAAGPGKMDENGNIRPLGLKVGDKVLFAAYAGSEVKMDLDDEEYLILSEDDILGIIQ